MQDIIKFEIVELVKEINKNHSDYLCPQTENILYHIYKDIITSEEVENISVLYRLIFYAYKQNPILSYQLLSGFLQFGQSDDGIQYKPLLDHLAIEVVDNLISLGGWSILKDCMNSLRDNLINLQNEAIFKHIVSRIVKQLYADEHEEESRDNLSDICHYLPREKSFTWGWFSYYIAEAYYVADPYHMVDVTNFTNKKKMRNYLMNYRKLITSLRQFVPIDEPHVITEYFPVENKLKETWEGVLDGLSLPDYKWAIDLINCIMTDTYDRVDNDEQKHITAAEMSLAIASADDLEKLIEKAIAKLQAQAHKEKLAEHLEEHLAEHLEEHLAEHLEEHLEQHIQGQEAEHLAEHKEQETQQTTQEEFTMVQPLVEEKNNNTSSWFGWLGWS